MKSRRALLRHVWSMAQTRAEAAGLVLSLQRSALGRGLTWYAVAAMAAIALMVSLLLLIAFGTPPAYRAWVLAGVSLLLFVTTAYCAIHAKAQLTRDAALIADFTKGLRLDLAMVNLALKDPETDDKEKLASRERAKAEVRDAAAEKAATPVAGAGAEPASSTDGPPMESAGVALRPAAPSPTELDLLHLPVTPPEEMTARAPPAQASHERSAHGTP